jgi:hypothetical protein
MITNLQMKGLKKCCINSIPDKTTRYSTSKVANNGRNDGSFFTKNDRQHGGLENAPHQVRQVVFAQGTLEHQEELVEPDRKKWYFFQVIFFVKMAERIHYTTSNV